MFKSNEDPLVVKLQFLMFSLEYSLYHSPKRKKKKKKKKRNNITNSKLLIQEHAPRLTAQDGNRMKINVKCKSHIVQLKCPKQFK